MSDKSDILTVAREVVKTDPYSINTPLEIRLAQAVIDLSAALESLAANVVTFNDSIPVIIGDSYYQQKCKERDELWKHLVAKSRAALDGKDLGGLKGGA